MKQKQILSVALIVTALGACQDKKPKEGKQGAETTPTSGYTPPYSYSQTPIYTGNSGNVTIREMNTQGDYLIVRLNQAVTWQFVATDNTTGQNVPIIRITPNAQTGGVPSGMIVNGNVVTFTPSSQQMMTGTLQVEVQAGTTTTTVVATPTPGNILGQFFGYPGTYGANVKTFTWSDGTGVGGLFPGGSGIGFTDLLPIYLIRLLPTLMNGSITWDSIIGAALQAYVSSLVFKIPGMIGAQTYPNPYGNQNQLWNFNGFINNTQYSLVPTPTQRR